MRTDAHTQVLAATESVAVLALLDNKDRPSHPLLFSLVFGESVFNDAVCIVLFESLYSFTHVPFSSETIGPFSFLHVFRKQCAIAPQPPTPFVLKNSFVPPLL